MSLSLADLAESAYYAGMKRIGRTGVLFAGLLVLGSVSTRGQAPSDSVTVQSAAGFDFAYYPGDQEGLGVEPGGLAPISYRVASPPAALNVTGAGPIGTTWGGLELKGFYQRAWTIPMLRWSDSPLAAGNNLNVRLRTGVSPISVTQEIQATLTPIALLQFTAGGLVGTGWNVRLFDGLGRVDVERGTVDDGSFEGVVTRVWGSATFQFDFSAVFPGDWTRVLVVASPQWTFEYFSGASDTQPWSFEADGGTNYNGWELGWTALLGYGLPRGALQVVGLLFESDQIIGGALDRALRAPGTNPQWQPGFISMNLGIVMNFALGEQQRHNLTVLPQLTRNRLPSDATVYQQATQAQNTIGGYWDIWRVAVSYRYQLD